MNYPDDFTNGDVDQITFRQACDAAAEGKPRIFVTQILKHAGVAPDSIEAYADSFMKFGSTVQTVSRLPKFVLGWLLVISGLVFTVMLLQSGWIAGITIIMIFAGIYCLVSK